MGGLLFGLGKVVVGGSQRQFVAGRAEAADDALREVAEVGMLAEGFAAVDVREVDFGKGDGDGGECVAQGNAGMGEGSGVDDDVIDFVFACGVDEVDEDAFVVVLDEFEVVAEAGRHFAEAVFDAVEGVMPVVRRFAAAEQVEVGAVDDKNERHRVCCLKWGGGRILMPATPYGIAGRGR